MQKLSLHEIREKYLSFFESKAHLRMPSFPLVPPQGDNSLLLINAGMAPLKPYFTGKEIPPSPRVTTCQKCIRTPDIERVGKTARHGTFFEMLGNFSFGDYFKHDATAWALEFSVDVMGFPVDKIWVSVYEEDDEAIEIWVNHVGFPRERIVKMGKEDTVFACFGFFCRMKQSKLPDAGAAVKNKQLAACFYADAGSVSAHCSKQPGRKPSQKAFPAFRAS